MPSPLGHTAIGLATHALYCKNRSILGSWKLLVFVVVLANLPDLDILFGLIFSGNGNAFHRGMSHSLLFALGMGLLSTHAWRCWPTIPRLNFLWCFLLILSHVLADAVFTNAPVSLWWPLEASRIAGDWGWSEVMNSVFTGAFQDIGVVFGFGLIIMISRLFKYGATVPVIRGLVKVKTSSISKNT
ncbi:MAG: metal-dependent hydrolase [Deltaproteobacteria bacterium]|nr:MAG: metal-dependent hydrolase [Deltaproteobacteria bacterium]